MKLLKTCLCLLMVFSVLGLGLIQTAQAQSLTIEKTWGGPDEDEDYGSGVAIDPLGNIYVTGQTKSFGAGQADVLLLKYDPSGELLWQKTWGGKGEDFGWAAASAPSGNIYVTGVTEGFGAGTCDVLLLKYDPSGKLLWQKTWGGIGYDLGCGVDVDRSGNVYVTGETYSFGAGGDVFLLKYDSKGMLLWQKTWGGKAPDLGCGLAVDPSGSIYVTGRTVSFGAGPYAALLLKYGPDGTLLWQKTWGGRREDYVRGHVAIDPSGSIYVTGKTESFGAGHADVLLLKYDPSGTLLWQKTWGGTGEDLCWDVAVDPSGIIYVTGRTSSFGAGQRDALLLKYDPSGTLLWQKIWGGTEWDSSCALAVHPPGNIYVTGLTASPSRTLQDVSGTETTPDGTVTEPDGTETTPDGTVTEPDGTETTPAGSETCAGGQDAFLLVFKPSPQEKRD